MLTTAVFASIPSPDDSVWYLGPVPIRAYSLAILLGIVVAVWVGDRRWVARGGARGEVLDIAILPVLFGIIGARVYHVLTDWDRYFGAGSDPTEALRIWTGGLSVWGAIAAGVLGGWIAARRKGIPFAALADALAPGIVLAQAIGRWGNYFNQELFGRPTDVPWALEIDEAHRPVGYENVETFHPTFLYESLWAVGVALVLIWADRRFRMGHGRVFALYVALYTLGRTWIETLRIDTGGVVEGPAREILGLRINAWVSVLLFVGAVAYIVVSARRHPGRETIDRGEAGEPVGSGDAIASDPGAESGVESAGDEESGSDVATDGETRVDVDTKVDVEAEPADVEAEPADVEAEPADADAEPADADAEPADADAEPAEAREGSSDGREGDGREGSDDATDDETDVLEEAKTIEEAWARKSSPAREEDKAGRDPEQ